VSTTAAEALTFDEVRALVPQRFPFLMIDRVTALERGKRIVAIKNVTANEIYFVGHFEELAVMPAVLILESMAQAAIVLFRKSFADPDDGGSRMFLLGAAKARFLHPVFPGDQLELDVTIQKAVSTGAVAEAVASVAGRMVATADLTFGVKALTDVRERSAEAAHDRR
jgi:3-hydroxyacyl-[acyl-carrier-protein] dehydratase